MNLRIFMDWVGDRFVHARPRCGSGRRPARVGEEGARVGEEGDMVANVALSDMTNDVSANANALVDLSDRIDEEDEKNPNWMMTLKKVAPELKLSW